MTHPTKLGASPLPADSPTLPADAGSPYEIRRVRHELKRRRLRVRRTRRLSPAMLRVTLTGEDLGDFTSLGFDDHVKLVFPGDGAPLMRDYTPRRFDPSALELDIDFALHEAGPATAWALQAQPGDGLEVVGPKGSFIVPTALDWHLLAGDETALPAIGRRLEELPAGVHAQVFAEVGGPEDEIALPSRAQLHLTWLHRDGSGTFRLEAALAGFRPPAGEGYAWAACEASVAPRLRQVLLGSFGLPKARVRVSAYWKRGAGGFHETLAD